MQAKKKSSLRAFFTKKIWWERKKVVTLHSVSGMKESIEDSGA